MKKKKVYKSWAVFGDYGGPFLETISRTKQDAIEKFCGHTVTWESMLAIGRTCKRIEMTLRWNA